MGDLIKITARQEPAKSAPLDLFALRWRLAIVGGAEVVSDWTPGQNPSMTMALRDYAGRIEMLFIEGCHRFNRDQCVFIACPGSGVAGLSYKAGFVLGQKASVIGIELEAVDGQRFLVMRDGNVNTFKPEQANVSDDHK